MIYYTYSMTTCRVLEMAGPTGIHTICSSVGMKLTNGFTLITIHSILSYSDKMRALNAFL